MEAAKIGPWKFGTWALSGEWVLPRDTMVIPFDFKTLITWKVWT